MHAQSCHGGLVSALSQQIPSLHIGLFVSFTRGKYPGRRSEQLTLCVLPWHAWFQLARRKVSVPYPLFVSWVQAFAGSPASRPLSPCWLQRKDAVGGLSFDLRVSFRHSWLTAHASPSSRPVLLCPSAAVVLESLPLPCRCGQLITFFSAHFRFFLTVCLPVVVPRSGWNTVLTRSLQSATRRYPGDLAVWRSDRTHA